MNESYKKIKCEICGHELWFPPLDDPYYLPYSTFCAFCGQIYQANKPVPATIEKGGNIWIDE